MIEGVVDSQFAVWPAAAARRGPCAGGESALMAQAWRPRSNTCVVALLLTMAGLLPAATAFTVAMPHRGFTGCALAREPWSIQARNRGHRGDGWVAMSTGTPEGTTATTSAPVESARGVTELPDSFDDSVARMAAFTLQALDEGCQRARIDFDTSVGDMTYTLLKQSLPFAQKLTDALARALIVSKQQPEGGGGEEGKAAGVTGADSPTLRLFFPDAGSAALAQREWKAGAEEALVPGCVRFASMTKFDEPADSDIGCIVLCPRNSEADEVVRILKQVGEKGQFMVLVNPELVNMDTTGYGLAGRRVRDKVLGTFQTTYYLRTLPWGALTREHGKDYTVWQEDATDPTGYRLLTVVEQRPSMVDLEEMYEQANGLSQEGPSTPKFLDGVADFVRDFGRL